MYKPTGVAGLAQGFRGEAGEKIEQALPYVDHQEKCGQGQKGSAGTAPPPGEQSKEEREEQEPVALEERVDEDREEDILLPSKSEARERFAVAEGQTMHPFEGAPRAP